MKLCNCRANWWCRLCKSGAKVVQAVQKWCKTGTRKSGAKVVQAVQKWCKSGASCATAVQKHAKVVQNWCKLCKRGAKVVQAVQKWCKLCKSGAKVVQAVQKWCKARGLFDAGMIAVFFQLFFHSSSS
jgi:type II secretory pathway component PulF